MDAWEESDKASAIKIKDEPVDESTSRDSRKRSSDHHVSSSSRTERRVESKSREKSWERRPRDPRHIRARSPPRHRSPPRKAGSAFLEDLKKKMENQGKDTSFIDDYKNPHHSLNINIGRNNQNYYENVNQQQFAQQQQNMMMMNNYPQMPNMMQMNYQQFNPQVQYDMYGNPLMIPPLMSMDIPQPVPPPMAAPGTIPPHQYVSPEPMIIPHQQQQQSNGNNFVTKQNNNAMKKVKFSNDYHKISVKIIYLRRFKKGI